MAKKKGGGEASKKSEQKKKARIVEDKCFGLKNKNKSKKVQAFINATTKSVMNGGDPKKRREDEQRKRNNAAKKARKKALEEERNALFGEALLAVKKKTSTKKKTDDVAKGRDHNEGGKEKSGTSRAMKMMFQMDAKEMEEALTADPNYVRTIEDDIELQRQKKLKELQDKGLKGTPITEESFKAWQERKRKVKMDAARKLVDAELKKKKGGKGLSVLSGRELFDYKKDLFKDDEMGDDGNNRGNENDGDDMDTKPSAQTGESKLVEEDDKEIDKVAEKVKSDLFLDGDDDDFDLDDLDDLDDD